MSQFAHSAHSSFACSKTVCVACSGLSGGWWRIDFESAAGLAVPLTVAVHRLKKPFVYAGFPGGLRSGLSFIR